VRWNVAPGGGRRGDCAMNEMRHVPEQAQGMSHIACDICVELG